MIDSNYFESNLTIFFKSDDRRSQKKEKEKYIYCRRTDKYSTRKSYEYI